MTLYILLCKCLFYSLFFKTVHNNTPSTFHSTHLIANIQVLTLVQKWVNFILEIISCG